MRKTLLTLVLVCLMALPVLAQRRGGFGMFGGGGPSGDALLQNKSVQDELKLTDAQKKQLDEVRTKMMETFAKAREDKENGREIIAKALEESAKTLKKLKDGLTTVQSKRLEQIQVQVAAKTHDANIFKNEHVQTALKLTPKQKETIKETLSDLDKDGKEVMADAKGDRKKMPEAAKKIGTLRKDAYEKITKALTDDQTKTLTGLGGEAFELKMEGGPFGKDKGGRRKDKKKDSF